MKYPFFASFLLFVFAVQFAIRRARSKNTKSDKTFWEREAAANNVRRKPLDDIEYINIPLEKLPTDVLTDDETVSDCIRELEELSQTQIVNLTGITNTDLKMKYGVANLKMLSACDDRFTILVQTLQKWADYLWEKGQLDASQIIMEYEVKIQADVGSAYRKLAKLYKDKGETTKIDELIEVAKGLPSASSKSIVRYLEEYR